MPRPWPKTKHAHTSTSFNIKIASVTVQFTDEQSIPVTAVVSNASQSTGQSLCIAAAFAAIEPTNDHF